MQPARAAMRVEIPEPTERPVKGRSCGDCTLCCKIFRIDPARDDDDGLRLEFYKPPNEWCPEVCESGCGIYERRPLSCRYFKCAWLEGFFPDDWRPDQSKVVTTVEDHRKWGRRFVVYEQWRGVAKSGKALRTVEYLRQGVTVEGRKLPVLLTDNRVGTQNEFFSWVGWKPVIMDHQDPSELYHIRDEDRPDRDDDDEVIARVMKGEEP